MGAPTNKDKWDKAGIILSPVGGLLAALTVAFLGVKGSQFLEKQQTADANARLYTELMSKREDSETSLRRDMFTSIIGSFLKGDTSSVDADLLHLELLAYNFHESLDMGPLFKHMQERISKLRKADASQFMSRLERVANDVKGVQFEELRSCYGHLWCFVNLNELTANIKKDSACTIINDSLELSDQAAGMDGNTVSTKRYFTVVATDADASTKSIQVRLDVNSPGDSIQISARPFWVDPFDLPMIDNTRLTHDQRCAIVLTPLGGPFAQVDLLYFPGSHASLREKPYYDDIVQKLVRSKHSIQSQ